MAPSRTTAVGDDRVSERLREATSARTGSRDAFSSSPCRSRQRARLTTLEGMPVHDRRVSGTMRERLLVGSAGAFAVSLVLRHDTEVVGRAVSRRASPCPPLRAAASSYSSPPLIAATARRCGRGRPSTPRRCNRVVDARVRLPGTRRHSFSPRSGRRHDTRAIAAAASTLQPAATSSPVAHARELSRPRQPLSRSSPAAPVERRRSAAHRARRSVSTRVLEPRPGRTEVCELGIDPSEPSSAASRGAVRLDVQRAATNV